MLKTKPSHAILYGVALATLVACSRPEPSKTPDGARLMRPIGEVLFLRMTPYRTTELRFGEGDPVRRVPESFVRWRVEATLEAVLGSNSQLVKVGIDGQSATLTGSVATGWQADEVKARLANIDVLRAATIEWRVVDPNAARPLPQGPTDRDLLERDKPTGAGTTPLSP